MHVVAASMDARGSGGTDLSRRPGAAPQHTGCARQRGVPRPSRELRCQRRPSRSGRRSRGLVQYLEPLNGPAALFVGDGVAPGWHGVDRASRPAPGVGMGWQPRDLFTAFVVPLDWTSAELPDLIPASSS